MNMGSALNTIMTTKNAWDTTMITENVMGTIMTTRNAMDTTMNMEKVQAIIMSMNIITMTTAMVMAMGAAVRATTMHMGTITTMRMRYLPAGDGRRPGLMRRSSWSIFWTSCQEKRTTALF